MLTPVPFGPGFARLGIIRVQVTGAGRTEQALRRMVMPHTVELNKMPDWSAQLEPIPGGLRLTVAAKNPEDAKWMEK